MRELVFVCALHRYSSYLSLHTGCSDIQYRYYVGSIKVDRAQRRLTCSGIRFPRKRVSAYTGRVVSAPKSKSSCKDASSCNQLMSGERFW